MIENPGDNSAGGLGVQLWHGNNLQVENNTFTGSIDEGTESYYTSDDWQYNHYAVVNFTSYFINGGWSDIDGNVNIKNNEMTNLYLGTCSFSSTGDISSNVTDNNYIGIQVGQVDDVYATAATQGVSIENNDITNNYRGIWVRSFVPDGMHASYNNIVNNEEYGIYNSDDNTFDATNNWWGDSSGPSGVGPGEGDSISENVDFDPWLNAPYPEGSPIGFENSKTQEGVGDDNTVDAENETSTTVLFENVDSGVSGSVTVGVPDNNPGGSTPGIPVKFVGISTTIPEDNINEVRITIHYDDSEVSGMNERSLTIYHWNGSNWESLPTTVDTENNTATAVTDSLSFFSLAGTGFQVSVEKGWNLISLPVIPENSSIENVLSDVKDDVEKVWYYSAATGEWSVYVPEKPSNDLQEMVDGKGYQIEMKNAGILEFSGNEHVPEGQVPRSYDVYEGWNLIGYKETFQMTLNKYIGPGLSPHLARCYEGANYNLIRSDDNMTPGYGYWLAVTEPGTVYP